MVAIARRQSGVIDFQQLQGLGFTRHHIARLVGDGHLRRIHKGVYASGLTALVPRGHLVAAQLALGPEAFFSNRTAAALNGHRRPLNIHELELTVVADRTPKRPGLRIHRIRCAPDPSEVRIHAGLLRVSSPSRTLVDLAARETEAELDRLIAEMARRHQLDVALIDAVVRRRARTAGRARLEAALARYRPKPAGASGFEDAFAAWLTTHPDIPPPQRNIRLGPWEIDFFWPAHRLAVETDGDPYHCTPAELERDRVKDGWLQRHEIRILRVTEFRFGHDRPGIRTDLCALLEHA